MRVSVRIVYSLLKMCSLFKRQPYTSEPGERRIYSRHVGINQWKTVFVEVQN